MPDDSPAIHRARELASQVLAPAAHPVPREALFLLVSGSRPPIKESLGGLLTRPRGPWVECGRFPEQDGVPRVSNVDRA